MRVMFGRCSGELRNVCGEPFFTGGRAARFPSPVTPDFSYVRKSSNGPYRARPA